MADIFTDADRALLQSIAAKVAMIGAVVSIPPPATVAKYGESLIAETDVLFVQDFIVSGFSISDWTSLVFTLKLIPEENDDNESFVAVRVSNPPNAANDGLIWHRCAAVASASSLRSCGAIVVTSTNPTTFTLMLKAKAMDLQPSLDNLPHTYEVDLWRSDPDNKEQVAKGPFVLNRSVRRSPSIPVVA